MPIKIKLVRDKVVSRMEAEGLKVEYYIADESQKPVLFNMKIREECEEVIADPSPEECGDVMQAAYEIAKLHGFDMYQIESTRLLQEAEGRSVEMHIEDEKNYPRLLNMKLRETCEEVIANPHLNELANVVAVIYAIAKLRNHTQQEIEYARHLKYQENGGFEKGHVVTFRT